MKTRIIVLPLLFLLLTLPLFSQERVEEQEESLRSADPVEERALGGKLERIVDRAGLLYPGQKSSLMDRLNTLSEQYKFDLVIVTESNIGDASPMNYADDFFDYNDFGFGSLSDTRSFNYKALEDDNDPSRGRDGCLLLIVAGTRDYWISTSGRGIDLLTGYAFEKLESDALQFLKENNYHAAFISFLDNWEKFLILENKNRRYGFLEQWNIVVVLVGWLVALAVGFIVVHIWKKGMDTAFLQTQADSYVVNGSLAFDAKTDRFLYSVVTKTARPTDEGSSASSGGRSHMGSSGRSHGGGGGRF